MDQLVYRGFYQRGLPDYVFTYFRGCSTSSEFVETLYCRHHTAVWSAELGLLNPQQFAAEVISVLAALAEDSVARELMDNYMHQPNHQN